MDKLFGEWESSRKKFKDDDINNNSYKQITIKHQSYIFVRKKILNINLKNNNFIIYMFFYSL